MPYKRSYRPRRRFNKSSKYNKSRSLVKFRRRPRDTFDYARTAWRAAMQLKRIVNVEHKTFDYAETGIAATASWQIRNLSGISQGDTDNTRDGDSVKPLSISVRILLRGAGGSQDTNRNYLRIILLRGKHENGDGTTQYLDAYEDGAAGIVDLLKFKQAEERYNSTTLHDKTYSVSPTVSMSNDTYNFMEFVVKLNGHIDFPGTGTAPNNGGLYLLFATVDPSGQAFDVHSRIIYTDN